MSTWSGWTAVASGTCPISFGCGVRKLAYSRFPSVFPSCAGHSALAAWTSVPSRCTRGRCIVVVIVVLWSCAYLRVGLLPCDSSFESHNAFNQKFGEFPRPHLLFSEMPGAKSGIVHVISGANEPRKQLGDFWCIGDNHSRFLYRHSVWSHLSQLTLMYYRDLRIFVLCNVWPFTFFQ